MVGECQIYNLDDILSQTEIRVIIEKALSIYDNFNLVRSEFKPVSEEGIAGFLGDHLKGALYVEIDGRRTVVNIFIKRMPVINKPKADFIVEKCYYKRERLIFSLAEEFDELDANPWLPKAYIYNDVLLVLPDLSVQGYASRNYLSTLDLPHALLTAASLARFHAAYANYETKRSGNGVHYNILNDYGDILEEPTLKDSPWLRAAAKLTANFIATFSSKYGDSNLEKYLIKLYLEACNSLRQYEDTINVLIHKDLWMNNIMFKYENGVPVNAMLVDFQLLRYGPPTFDLMIFLYLTTSRSFREEYEDEVFRHYYKVFCDALDDDTKERINQLGYDKQEFLVWCEKGRMFGMLAALTFFPFVLMDPKTAQDTFDDPETYDKYVNEDRSEPVIAHAKKCAPYKNIQLEVCEEFVERYVLKKSSHKLLSEG